LYKGDSELFIYVCAVFVVPNTFVSGSNTHINFPLGNVDFNIFIDVSEPSAEIIGGPEMYIDRGSTINLTCVVKNSPEPPAYIFWNHNDAVRASCIQISN
jgi:hypothetical protein